MIPKILDLEERKLLDDIYLRQRNFGFDINRINTRVSKLESKLESETSKFADLKEDIKEIKQYIEKRLFANSERIENQKIYFNKYIKSAFDRLDVLERENRELKENLESFEETITETVEKLKLDIEDLTLNFEKLQI